MAELAANKLQIVAHLLNNRVQLVIVVNYAQVFVMEGELAVVEIILDITLFDGFLQQRIVQTVVHPGSTQIELQTRLGRHCVQPTTEPVSCLKNNRVNTIFVELDTGFETRNARANHNRRMHIRRHDGGSCG